MLPVFSQPVGRGFRRSGASLLDVPQPVTDPFRAALMRVSSSSSFYPDFYGIKASEKKSRSSFTYRQQTVDVIKLVLGSDLKLLIRIVLWISNFTGSYLNLRHSIHHLESRVINISKLVNQ